MAATISSASSESSACRPMPNDKWLLRRGAFLFRLAGLAGLGLAGCKPAGAHAKPWQEFSGEKALAHVQALVDLGPRPPASAALEKARAYIRENLEAYGWKVEAQPFTDQTPRGTVSFVNLIATWPAKHAGETQRFLLCSHYDTKTFDSITFVGANDGGSSTGALLEMARVLSLHPQLSAKIELVFFDGEEAYEQFSATDGLYGSRYFAHQISDSKTEKTYRSSILWDMTGDRDLTITLPPDSPAELARGIFAAADALQVRNHFTYFSEDILDDHSPLNAIGIPAIDLIDFDYPPWHTAGDTMDKLSAESLQTVGAVTVYYLSEIAFQ
jgi:glutaminyl-peptide cyclotransferase